MSAEELPGLSRAALRWAIAAAPGELSSVAAIGGGITNTKWVLDLSAGERLVLRWSDPARWGSVGREHVRREVVGCQLLVDSSVPVPAVVAVDLDGAVAGGPANLLTWRGGQSRLDPLSRSAIDELARVAVEIHRHPVPVTRRIPLRSRGDGPPRVPEWTARPELWEEAITVVGAGAPATTHGLLHCDFHLGNVLWEGDAITGIIDWAETAWGPVDLDVAHMCADLAMMHTPATAALFRDAYLLAGNDLDTDFDVFRYWLVSDILGFLPDPAHILPAVSPARPDLTAHTIRGNLEELLASHPHLRPGPAHLHRSWPKTVASGRS